MSNGLHDIESDGEDVPNGRAGACNGSTDDVALRDNRVRRLTASASAGQLHVFLKSLQATGNEVQLAFMETLQALHECRGFIEMGCSSFRHYCQMELGLSRTTAYEYLRCARALAALPVTATMFRDGDLSWDRVKAISRVATANTEVNWIQVALESSVRELRVEVRSAQEDGRDKPRDDRYGLPNLMTRLVLDLTLEDKERLLVALARAADSLGVSEDYVLGTRSRRIHRRGTGPDPVGRSGSSRDDRLGMTDERTNIRREHRREGGGSGTDSRSEDRGVRLLQLDDDSEPEADGRLPDDGPSRSPDPRTALLGLVDAILAGRFKVSGIREPGHADPAVFVAYNGCPDCNRAKAHTRYGALEIAPELLAKRAEEAQTLVIPEEAEFEERDLAPGERDKPNSALLAKRVLFRDGLQCATPGCTNRRGLQAHHMQHRADGGPTVMKNLSSQCPICHSLEHLDLLEVTGNATTGELTWKRKPRASDVEPTEVDVLVAKAARLTEAGRRASRSDMQQTGAQAEIGPDEEVGTCADEDVGTCADDEVEGGTCAQVNDKDDGGTGAQVNADVGDQAGVQPDGRADEVGGMGASGRVGDRNGTSTFSLESRRSGVEQGDRASLGDNVGRAAEESVRRTLPEPGAHGRVVRTRERHRVSVRRTRAP